MLMPLPLPQMWEKMALVRHNEAKMATATRHKLYDVQVRIHAVGAARLELCMGCRGC